MSINSWFSNFPKIQYTNLDRTKSFVTNIFHYIRIQNMVKNNSYVYYEYQVVDGDTPEMIASRYYGDPNYVWILFLANDLTSRYTDWPLSNEEFVNHIISRYGSIQNAQQTLHHYEDENGNYVDPGTTSNPLTLNGFVVSAYNTSSIGYFLLPLSMQSDINNNQYSQLSINIISGPAAGTTKTSSSITNNLVTLNSIWADVPLPGDLFQIGPIGVVTSNFVSIYDFEYTANENKRTIKLLDKNYLEQITNEFLSIIQNIN